MGWCSQPCRLGSYQCSPGEKGFPPFQATWRAASHSILPDAIRSVSAWNTSTSGTDLLCLELHSTLVSALTLFSKKKTFLSPWKCSTWCWAKHKGTFGFHSTKEQSPPAVVLGEHGTDVGIKCSTFWKEISFQSKQGAASLLQETAEAATDTRRLKGAGGVGGGRSDLQGGEEGFYFPPDPSVPEHQSHLTTCL